MTFQRFSIFLLGLAPGGALAAGYYLPNQDAFATARGNAFVATADSAAAVHYNPAGMTQLERPEAEAGFYSIVLGHETNAGGVTTEAKKELQAVPQLYYAAPVNERMSYGFGLNSPWGLGTDWGRDTPFSPLVTEVRLMYLSGTAAMGYKVTDELSVGASFSVNYADMMLEQGLGIPGSYFGFSGDGFAVSGTLSTRWQPHEQHAFGLILASGSSFDLSGKTESSLLQSDSNSEMDFLTPARITGGYSYRPAPGWNFEANVEWLDWDSLNTLNLKTTSVPGTNVVPLQFDWKSSFIYEVGGSYITPEGYIFAAGYDFNQSSQPDATYSPSVSDKDHHYLNVGFGRKCEDFSWMLAYQFGFADRTVDGGQGMSALANGDYKSRHNALMFSWQQRF